LQHKRENKQKVFLKLISKYFPKGSALHKIFNKNTVKLSYCCLPNMAAIVSGHNKKQLTCRTPSVGCNCRNPAACPLNGACQEASIVYEVEVRTDESKTYTGLSKPTFKTRYNNHMSNMRNEDYRNATELSKYVWRLKDESKPYTLKWRISEHAKAYDPASKECRLCIAEKHRIITADKSTSLNKRTEFVSKCRHENAFRLANVTAIT